MRILKGIVAAGLFAALTASAAMAQDQAASFNAQNANVHSGTGGQPLTLPSQASAPSVVADFLRGEGLSGDTVGSLVLQSESSAPSNGLTHLRFGQQVDGLTVFGAYVKATVNGEGQLTHLIEALATPGNVRPAVVGARDALDAAMAENHPGVDVTLGAASGSDNTVSFTGDDFFYRDPTATRIAIAMNDGALQEGFLVETWSGEDNLLHHTLIGANGRVLGVQLRTNNDSYNIFPDHPGNSTQTVIVDPGTNSAESPSGWLAGTQTTVDIGGNNAHAYLDTDNNNASDGGGVVVGDGNFTTNANTNIQPEEPVNQAVAVQNLFYFNNVIHDKLYRHGFNEAAGNFQENNFGNSGSGGDSVDAEAQDGGGTNNANFSTPGDGSNPRMQMYIWTQSPIRRDGDVDSDIIWHEYGHGLTWRMIGSMSGPMSGAIGEGMGDVLAILNNDDDTVGEYSYYKTNGIRSAPYTNYPRTYGDFDGGSVHFDGEIYAAIGWHLWEIFQTNGVSKDTLFDYLIGGMNDTPSGPAFEDMRDGILQAALNDGAGHECLVWEAFADFGVGESAQGSVKGGGPFGGGKVNVTEDFSLPPECTGNPPQPEAPVASNDSYDVVAGTGLFTIAAPGVLSNDTDANGDTLTAVLKLGHASLTDFKADGSFTFDASGLVENNTASFTYVADDGDPNTAVSNEVTVTINVIAQPQDVVFSVQEIKFKQKGPNLTATVVLSEKISTDVKVEFCPSSFCTGSTVATSGKGEATWMIRYNSGTPLYTVTVITVDDQPGYVWGDVDPVVGTYPAP